MRLNIDRDLVKQLVSGQLPNKSRHLDELTHEPSIWQCDTGQWLSCFDSCQLTILWMANIKDVDLPRHAWDTPPFLLIVSPTLPVQSEDAYLRQSRDNQTKKGWPYSMRMRLCPTCGSPAIILRIYYATHTSSFRPQVMEKVGKILTISRPSSTRTLSIPHSNTELNHI